MWKTQWEEWEIIAAEHRAGSFINLLVRHPSWSLLSDSTEIPRVFWFAAEEQLPCSVYEMYHLPWLP